MSFNILKIDIDVEKLKEKIEEYIFRHNSCLNLQIDSHPIYEKPIILMSYDTLSLIRAKTETILTCKETKKQNYLETFYGCKIAIASWLKGGEIQLASQLKGEIQLK